MIASHCDIAFKEWAAVCEALATGRQTIVLRKGGIQEGREGFSVQHREFWFYPTRFHESAESLIPDAALLAARAAASGPPPGKVPLNLFAVVQEVHELATEDAVLRMAGLHIWSQATIRQRFHYRRPGLFLLVLRVYMDRGIHWVNETPEMAGCKSWVALPERIPTAGVSPVLSDVQFDQATRAIQAAL
jgi:hypothetical protein